MYTKIIRSEAFADSLERQCRLNTQPVDDDFGEAVERRVRMIRRNQEVQVIRFTTPEEGRDLIRKAKVRKTLGSDQISNTIMKHLINRAVVVLTSIINAMLRLKYFTKKWKTAEVTWLPKLGKHGTFTHNYCPNSLLPAMGNIS